MTPEVEFRMLGPMEVRVGGRALPLGGKKQRVVLAMLLLDANRMVPADRIFDAVWGDMASERSTGTLHVYVSNLRRALEPAANALGVAELIATQRPGYVLHAEPERVDLLRFEQTVNEARRAAERGDHATASSCFHAAADLWHGAPLADLADEEFAQGTVVRLERLRVSALDALYESDLALGRHADVLDRLPGAIAADPLNERLRGLYMLALYRAGRQADALAAYRDAREVLVEELGIDPGPYLREMESRVLVQDPNLDLAGTGTGSVPVLDDAPSTVVRREESVLARLVIEPSAGDDPGAQPGEVHDIVRPVTTIGRRADRSVVLADPDVSRNHCEIRRGAFGFTVVDTGSTNGTRVNGELVEEQRLVDGDEIIVGNTTITFTLAPGP